MANECPHHANVEDHATTTALAVIGGHGIIGEGASLGLSCVLHQRLTVGARDIVGMGAVVTKHVPPFAITFGTPSRINGANRVGMQCLGYGGAVIANTAARSRPS